MFFLLRALWERHRLLKASSRTQKGNRLKVLMYVSSRETVKRYSAWLTTNPNCRYVSTGLAAGTYRVTLLVNGAVKAVIKNTQTTPGRATQLNFALKPSSVSQVGPIGKRGRHMVWVPARTGSHVGGSWVEVDVNGNPADDSPVETATGDQLRRQQLTQPTWSIRGQGGAGIPPSP